MLVSTHVWSKQRSFCCLSAVREVFHTVESISNISPFAFLALEKWIILPPVVFAGFMWTQIWHDKPTIPIFSCKHRIGHWQKDLFFLSERYFFCFYLNYSQRNSSFSLRGSTNSMVFQHYGQYDISDLDISLYIHCSEST